MPGRASEVGTDIGTANNNLTVNKHAVKAALWSGMSTGGVHASLCMNMLMCVYSSPTPFFTFYLCAICSLSL